MELLQREATNSGANARRRVVVENKQTGDRITRSVPILGDEQAASTDEAEYSTDDAELYCEQSTNHRVSPNADFLKAAVMRFTSRVSVQLMHHREDLYLCWLYLPVAHSVGWPISQMPDRSTCF